MNEEFDPIGEADIRVYSLDKPALKAIAFAGPTHLLERLPVFSKCTECSKNWTYFVYDELTNEERERFNLEPGEHLEIQILEKQ